VTPLGESPPRLPLPYERPVPASVPEENTGGRPREPSAALLPPPHGCEGLLARLAYLPPRDFALPEGDDYLHVHLNLDLAALARARYAGRGDHCVARVGESFDVDLQRAQLLPSAQRLTPSWPW
jgi:hypothetical protein